ncbi:MAG: hypothetical protein ACPGN6_02450 [Gammaproteobacteria bacterium]
MRALARFAMRGHWHAVVLTVLGLICSTVISIFGVISGSIVALVAMRIGWLSGLKLALTSVIFFCLFQFFMTGYTPLTALYVSVIVLGLPVLLGVALDSSSNQALPLLIVASGLILFSLAFRILTGDADQFWFQQINPILNALQEANGPILSEQAVMQISSQMHHIFLVLIFLFYTAIIFLARWWQAELYNPGGFGFEFRVLRMPKSALYGVAIAGVMVALNTVSSFDVAFVTDCFIVLVLLFSFQGLAVVHAKIYTNNLPVGWLVGLYLLSAIVPQLVGLVLATTGVADSLADFRRAKVS